MTQYVTGLRLLYCLLSLLNSKINFYLIFILVSKVCVETHYLNARIRFSIWVRNYLRFTICCVILLWLKCWIVQKWMLIFGLLLWRLQRRWIIYKVRLKLFSCYIIANNLALTKWAFVLLSVSHYTWGTKFMATWIQDYSLTIWIITFKTNFAGVRRYAVIFVWAFALFNLKSKVLLRGYNFIHFFVLDSILYLFYSHQFILLFYLLLS